MRSCYLILKGTLLIAPILLLFTSEFKPNYLPVSIINPELLNDDIEISIKPLQEQYIKGKMINILVKIRNNSSDIVRLPKPKQYLYSYKNLETKQSPEEYLLVRTIPSHQDYVYLLSPVHSINSKKEGQVAGLPWFYWDEGSYEYYISFKVNGTTLTSNKISIIVNPVPDTLVKEFEDLKDYPEKSRTLNDYENLVEKYKGTFYEQEYLYKLLSTYDYYLAISKNNAGTLRQKALDLYKEYILKYPDTYAASVFFTDIYGGRDINETLLKEISNSLKKSGEGEILMKIIKQKLSSPELDKYGF